MLFESTTLLLRSIVDALQSGDESKWDDHREFGNQCIYELFQMCRPERRKYEGHLATVFDRASRTIPLVKEMNRAIRQKDRAAAVEHGKAALSAMYGIPNVVVLKPPVQPELVKSSPRPVPITEQRKKPVNTLKTVRPRATSSKSKPVPAAPTKRKVARVSAAS
jgi:hypothetical protein